LTEVRKILDPPLARISALRHLKDFADRETLLSVYNALIHPYFTYCCEVWDVFGKHNKKDCKNVRIEQLESSQILAMMLIILLL
jgi:hypothetical protein